VVAVGVAVGVVVAVAVGVVVAVAVGVGVAVAVTTTYRAKGLGSGLAPFLVGGHMTTFHRRSTLGLAAPNPAKLAARTAEELHDSLGLTIHHTGFGGTLYKPDPIARLRGIQAYHMETLGYGDIAYELAFDADANVYELRDGKYVGAHAYGSKRGGNTPNVYTDGLVYLEDARGWTRGGSIALNWCMDLFGLARQGRHPHLFAHEWWSVTACPQSYLIDVVRFAGGSA